MSSEIEQRQTPLQVSEPLRFLEVINPLRDL